MNNLLRAWVGDGQAKARKRAGTAGATTSMNRPNNVNMAEAEKSQFSYHFNNVPVARQPGPAYHSPLLMFQQYIPNVWEGWGGKAVIDAISRGTQFAAFEPLTANQALMPVTTGGTGTIQGQLFGTPLIDTNPDAVTVG